MEIIQSFLTKNPCFVEGRRIKVRGLMLHSVGSGRPSAESYLQYWNNESFDRACVHAFIDGNTGRIYQSLPWNYRAWHAGGIANNTHIGIEMCESSAIRYINGAELTCSDIRAASIVSKRTYDAAVELFASLSLVFDLDPLKRGVIVSHSEGFALGIASDHKDPEHVWSQLNLPYTMDGFRIDIIKKMDETRV